jgi:hypothetical protein
MKSFITFFLLCLVSVVHALEVKKLELNSAFLTYYQNHQDSVSPNIENLIITVSGSERNAETYLKTMDAITKKLQVNEKTLIIAPHFKINGDVIAAKEMVYSYEGWWIGDQTLLPNKLNSSFDSIDVLIKKYSDKKRFPKLKNVILTGHSAGGHLVQRFALGTRLNEAKLGVNIKFVVSNPGTYVYLNDKRWKNDELKVPLRPSCQYNRYKYGLDNLNPYMSRTTISLMIESYLKRDVTYFLGEKDVGNVEQSCEAQFQGANRFVRGRNFKAFMDQEFPRHGHEMVVVPGIGHTQHGMYNSREAEETIFRDL